MSLQNQFDPLLARTTNPAAEPEVKQDAPLQSRSTRSTSTNEDLLSLFLVSDPSLPLRGEGDGGAAATPLPPLLSPMTSTSQGTSTSTDSETTGRDNDVYDVRKTRKERIMMTSDPSFASISARSLASNFNRGTASGPESASSSYSSSTTYLDNPNFCPPPKVPLETIKTKYEFDAETQQWKGSMPKFHLVRHSGYIMTRFSAASLLFKRWRQSFWILYAQSYLCFFRSKDDFEEWMFNPYLSRDRRVKLIKRCLDFRPEALKSVEVDPIGKKFYRKGGTMLHFKVDKHYVYADAISAVIIGAFASLNSSDVIELHTIMMELMKLSRPRLSSTINNNREKQQNHENSYNNRDGGDLRSVNSFSIASGTSTRMSSAYTL